MFLVFLKFCVEDFVFFLFGMMFLFGKVVLGDNCFFWKIWKVWVGFIVFGCWFFGVCVWWRCDVLVGGFFCSCGCFVIVYCVLFGEGFCFFCFWVVWVYWGSYDFKNIFFILSGVGELIWFFVKWFGGVLWTLLEVLT